MADNKKHDPWFETIENRMLLAICARKTIRGIGIGGIIWGIINLGIGFFAVQENIINVGLALVALVILGTGIFALVQPTRTAILLEAISVAILLLWNIGIGIFNYHFTDEVQTGGILFPLIISASFFGQYLRLKPLDEMISELDSQQVKTAQEMCKRLFAHKLKKTPDVIASRWEACRLQFSDNGVFLAHKDSSRMFNMSHSDFFSTIKDPDSKKLKMQVKHPLGKQEYTFDKKNSEKIRECLVRYSNAGIDNEEPETTATA